MKINLKPVLLLSILSLGNTNNANYDCQADAVANIDWINEELPGSDKPKVATEQAEEQSFAEEPKVAAEQVVVAEVVDTHAQKAEYEPVKAEVSLSDYQSELPEAPASNIKPKRMSKLKKAIISGIVAFIGIFAARRTAQLGYGSYVIYRGVRGIIRRQAENPDRIIETAEIHEYTAEIYNQGLQGWRGRMFARIAGLDPIATSSSLIDGNPIARRYMLAAEHDARLRQARKDYIEKFKDTKPTDKCAICLDDAFGEGDEAPVLPTRNCTQNHSLHFCCFQGWLKTKNECPLCKASDGRVAE